MNDPNTLRVKGRSGSGEVFYEGYDTALICKNGHVITTLFETAPDKYQDFCSICGAPTVKACDKCEAKIRGALHGTWPNLKGDPPPNFCYRCGKPYPWMEDRLQTAKELLDLDTQLTADDQQKLWGQLSYVISDPGAELAPAKKKLFEAGIRKALPATREFFLDLMAKFGAEMMKP